MSNARKPKSPHLTLENESHATLRDDNIPLVASMTGYTTTALRSMLDSAKAEGYSAVRIPLRPRGV